MIDLIRKIVYNLITATVLDAIFLLRKHHTSVIIYTRPCFSEIARTVAGERNAEQGRNILNAKTDTAYAWPLDGTGLRERTSTMNEDLTLGIIACLKASRNTQFPKFILESPGLPSLIIQAICFSCVKASDLRAFVRPLARLPISILSPRFISSNPLKAPAPVVAALMSGAGHLLVGGEL